MKIEARDVQKIKVRRLDFIGCPSGDFVVWWYGAVIKNDRTKSLPHVVVSFRRLQPDGTLTSFFQREVGITDLGLLQIGTIWNDWSCNRQIQFAEVEFPLNFTPGHWQIVNQRKHSRSVNDWLIPATHYPLEYRDRDRSELIAFDKSFGKLLVPCLEFYSRYYGRSGHVCRVLATYDWDAAEGRLYRPLYRPAPPGQWAIKLASSTYNSDAVFLAHVMYDDYARRAARSVYAQLEAQYQYFGGKAFPKITPWFKGRAKLIAQGLWLDEDTFLALRIAGGSDPQGDDVLAYRQNPGAAEEGAPAGSPLSGWKGGRDKKPSSPLIINLTSDDEPDHSSDVVEIINPVFRVTGQQREVIRVKEANATTTPAKPVPGDKADKHSPGERFGSTRGVGVAAFHTETRLESHGAAADVWEALVYLRKTMPERLTALGWYSAESRVLRFTEEPGMVALKPFDEENDVLVRPAQARWVFFDTRRSRGVLISHVQTPERSAFLFEIERRDVLRIGQDGKERTEEESFSGLIVSPAAIGPPDAWIPKVLDGIRRHSGVMEHVLAHCPSGRASDYRRSSSATDEIVGHSTAINALAKVGISIPRPRRKSRTDTTEK